MNNGNDTGLAGGDGPVTVHGYSPKAVTATANGGSITSNTYSTARSASRSSWRPAAPAPSRSR
jgi:hypothetical protein